jgi:hypothetical protein
MLVYAIYYRSHLITLVVLNISSLVYEHSVVMRLKTKNNWLNYVPFNAAQSIRYIPLYKQVYYYRPVL